MLTTLLMSFGTPMLFAGDELGNTQFGNNNPYCQDNVLTWLAWEAVDTTDRSLARFVKRLIGLRKKMKIFNRLKFFNGKYIGKYERYNIKDIIWFTENGKEFVTQDWYPDSRKCLSCFIYGGRKSYFIIYNADSRNIEWKLPDFCKKIEATLLVDSSEKWQADNVIDTTAEIDVSAWSVMVLELKNRRDNYAE
jgi:glycogen operon protein